MSDTKTMGAGRREDLKAILKEVSQFNAMGGGRIWFFRFSKEVVGEEAGWRRGGWMNRLGLEAFIGMTKKEWDDEHMKEKRNSVGASIHC